MRNGLGSRPCDQGHGILARMLGVLRPLLRRQAHRPGPNVTTGRRFLPELHPDDGKTVWSLELGAPIHGLRGPGCKG